MNNKFKNLKIQEKDLTPTSSFLLPKRGAVGNKKKKNLVRGFTLRPCGAFTLIETLVGVTILLVAVVGPLYTAFQGVSLSLLARDQITASFLAQEGIEFVRFRIGTNNNLGKSGAQLISFGDYALSDCSGQYCIIEVFNETPAAAITRCDFDALPGDDCQYLRYSTTTKKYDYDMTGDTYETLFRRSIRIDHDGLAGDTEFQVEAKVEWGRPDNVHSIILKEVIMDWQL